MRPYTEITVWPRETTESEGSVTIPNYINGFRNHLDLLLKSGNQVEILESGIIISMFILEYLKFPYIMNHMMRKHLFGQQESQESIQESCNQAKISKIPESGQQEFRVADPSTESYCICLHSK